MTAEQVVLAWAKTRKSFLVRQLIPIGTFSDGAIRWGICRAVKRGKLIKLGRGRYELS